MMQNVRLFIDAQVLAASMLMTSHDQDGIGCMFQVVSIDRVVHDQETGKMMAEITAEMDVQKKALLDQRSRVSDADGQKGNEL